MRAVSIPRLHDDEASAFRALNVSIVDRPSCSSDQVEVNIKAAGVNFFDILMLQGKYQYRPPLPFIPGAEFAGVVTKVGREARKSGLRTGDRVYGGARVGCYAEYICVPPESLRKIPERMDFAEAAVFRSAPTSWVGIVVRGEAKPGEVALIHAATSGLGTFAVQIAKSIGCTVIGTVGSPEKEKIAREVGCDHVINYRKNPKFSAMIKKLTAGKGADIIFDTVGGDTFDESTRCIAWNGRLLVVGFTSGRIATMKTNRILLKGCSVVGVRMGPFATHDPSVLERARAAVTDLFERGKLWPVVYRTYPFEDTAKAFEAIAKRRTYGKVALLTSEVVSASSKM